MPCVFCTDVNAAGEVLFEDDRIWVVLHDDWATRGHAMVVWKSHVENLSELSIADLLHFAVAYHRAERALLEVTHTDRAIVLKLGIATPHLHVHIFPVSSALDRTAVMEIIDGRVRDLPDETTRAAFLAKLRERLDGGG